MDAHFCSSQQHFPAKRPLFAEENAIKDVGAQSTKPNRSGIGDLSEASKRDNAAGLRRSVPDIAAFPRRLASAIRVS
jgi:hypothetical protein